MDPRVVVELSDRSRALLRAVGAGRCEVTGGSEPDLFVDGLACCDQVAAHNLVRAGLLRAVRVVSLSERAPAELTEEGRAAMRRPMAA